MEPAFLIGVDVGSTNIKAVLLDRRGVIHGQAHRRTPFMTAGEETEFPVHALTHAAWSAIAEVVRQAGAVDRIAGVAVASIGESFVVFDENGAPLADIIAWYDRRAAREAKLVVEAIGEENLFEITGLSIEPIYSICKLLWLRRHEPAVMEKAKGIALIADWLAFTLCGKLATDVSLASRTLLASPAQAVWSDSMLDAFTVNRSFLPPIRPTGTLLGPTNRRAQQELGLPSGCVVSVGGHDHILSSFAAGAADPGLMIDSAGTAEAILRTGPRFVPNWPEGPLEFAQGAIWWAGEPGPIIYLIGSMFDSGGAMARFRDGVGDKHSWERLVSAAEMAEPVSAIYRPDCGQHLKHDPAAWVDAVFPGVVDNAGVRFRAVLEGLALDSALLRDTMTHHAGLQPVREVRLVGGAAKNSLYAALKAAAMETSIRVAEFTQFTALGAALAAGLGAGVFRSLNHALETIELSWREVAPLPRLVASMQTLRTARESTP